MEFQWQKGVFFVAKLAKNRRKLAVAVGGAGAARERKGGELEDYLLDDRKNVERTPEPLTKISSSFFEG